MIPEAREVHLSRKDRKVLEACCRSPVTLQRDLKRARIVLLAAAGRSTRSIAKEVGVQPRIVSLWRHRFADLGLEGLQSKPRPGKQPIYTKSTGKRILKLLDKPPPAGFARWTGPLLAREPWRPLSSSAVCSCHNRDESIPINASGRPQVWKNNPKASVSCIEKDLQLLSENFPYVLQAKFEVAATSLIWVNDSTCSAAMVRCDS